MIIFIVLLSGCTKEEKNNMNKEFYYKVNKTHEQEYTYYKLISNKDNVLYYNSSVPVDETGKNTIDIDLFYFDKENPSSHIERETNIYDCSVNVLMNNDNNRVIISAGKNSDGKIVFEKEIVNNSNETIEKVSNDASIEKTTEFKQIEVDKNENYYFLKYNGDIIVKDKSMKDIEKYNEKKYINLVHLNEGGIGFLYEEMDLKVSLDIIKVEDFEIEKTIKFNLPISNVVSYNNKYYGINNNSVIEYELNSGEYITIINLFDYILPCEIDKMKIDSNGVIYLETRKQEEATESVIYFLTPTDKEHDEKSERITLSIIGPSHTLSDNALLGKRIKSYINDNPEINLEIITGDDILQNSDYAKRLNTELMSGNGPDIIFGIDYYENLGKEGYLEDLMPYYQNISEKYYENLVNVMKTGDKLYSLPYTIFLSCMWADIELLNKYDITIDDKTWTWNDFKNICEIIKEHNEPRPIILEEDLLRIIRIRMQCELDGSSSDIKNEEEKLKEILGYGQELFKNGYTSGTGQPIFGGDSLGYFDMNLEDVILRNHKKLALPNTGEYFYSSFDVAINANSKHKEEAFKLIQYYLDGANTSDEFRLNKQKMSEQYNTFINGEEWSSYGETDKFSKEEATKLRELIESQIQRVNKRESYKMIFNYDDTIKKVIINELSVEEGAKIIIEKLWRQTNE